MWKKIKDDQEMPKISKSLNVMKQSKYFWDILHRCIGVPNVPIVYLIREYVVVPDATPDLMAGKPQSIEAGSVEMELTNIESLIQPIFYEDNKRVYHHLEEATQGTSYAVLLKL